MSGQRLRGPAAVAAPLTGPRPDACAVAVTGVVEASPARKEFAVGWGANQFSPMLVAYRHELRLSARVEAALFGIYRRRRYPGCSSAARYRTGSGGGL
jgi:hypothetical protein